MPSNPDPMLLDPSPYTLKSLQEHVPPDQEERIKSLSERKLTTPASLHLCSRDEPWVKLWDAAWGKDMDLLDTSVEVKRDPHPIDDSLIPGVVPDKCHVMLVPRAVRICWPDIINCEGIFIRPDEYKEAEESAVSTCRHVRVNRAFLVTGQPGIGKSIFLLRLFLRRLGLKLPTALQVAPNSAMLFHEGGVERFGSLNDVALYNILQHEDDSPANRIWALVDSGSDLDKPALALRKGPFFVVEATPPRPARHSWLRDEPMTSFYMKLWSFSEVLQARHLIRRFSLKSEKDLWYLYSKYGASAGSLFGHADRPKEYEALVKDEINWLSPKKLTRLLRQPNAVAENFHYVISAGPMPGDRSEAERKFASTYVLEQCCKRILEDDAEALKKYYNILYDDPTTFAAARMVFGYRAHLFLREARVLELFPNLCRFSKSKKIKDAGKSAFYDDYKATKDTMPTKQVELPGLKEHVITDETEICVEYDTYYRPEHNNFPSIDSWVLLRPGDPAEPPIFLMFHITTNASSHDIKQMDLRMVDKLDIPANAWRCLVVFAPREVGPRIGPGMSKDYEDKKSRGSIDLDRDFPVFHYPADIDMVL